MEPSGELSEQIGMRSGSGEKKDQFLSVNAVDKKPIRQDMAFSKSGIIPGQFVIAIFRGQGFLFCQGLHSLIEQREIIVSS